MPLSQGFCETMKEPDGRWPAFQSSFSDLYTILMTSVVEDRADVAGRTSRTLMVYHG